MKNVQVCEILVFVGENITIRCCKAVSFEQKQHQVYKPENMNHQNE